MAPRFAMLLRNRAPDCSGGSVTAEDPARGCGAEDLDGAACRLAAGHVGACSWEDDDGPPVAEVVTSALGRLVPARWPKLARRIAQFVVSFVVVSALATVARDLLPAPWQPAGFHFAPGNESVAYRFMNVSEFECPSGTTCWGVEAITRDGCPTSLDVELTLLDADREIVGTTHASAGSVPRGARGRVVLQTYDQSVWNGRLTGLACS